MSISIEPLPPGLHCLADHEAHASRKLDAATWAWLQSGSAHGRTAAANLQAWDDIHLMPRVLRRIDGLHTRVELLGRTLAHPILAAPLAWQKLLHPAGELAGAHAAAAQGAGYVLSTQSSTRLEDVAAAVLGAPTRGPLWFQLYMQPRAQDTALLLRRAEDAGYEAVVVTVDVPVQPPREAIARAGFRVPAGLAANLPPTPQQDTATDLRALLAAAPSWDSLARLRELTRLPLLVKGIAHPDDVRIAVERGFDGVIVSNHGGRALDTQPPSAALLAPVVTAAAGRTPVLVDGGIRRGTDVLKALALGAAAVLVGRPIAWGLANAGALGVAHIIRLLRDELELALALTGTCSLDRIDAGLLRMPAGVR